ncbi:MAG: DUF1232 domain-containing protein [Anaerolineae bacterium]|nr:DUF1232 domain-containing protein [Anaerolineae bacterium]
MSDNANLPERREGVEAFIGWFREFFQQFQLAWRLFWDERVTLLTKLVPLGTVLYFLMPADVVPDLALGLGQLDDLAIFLVGIRVFIDLCPPNLVDEHKRALRGEQESWRPTTGPVIDLEVTIPPDGTEEYQSIVDLDVEMPSDEV